MPSLSASGFASRSAWLGVIRQAVPADAPWPTAPRSSSSTSRPASGQLERCGGADRAGADDGDLGRPGNFHRGIVRAGHPLTYASRRGNRPGPRRRPRMGLRRLRIGCEVAHQLDDRGDRDRARRRRPRVARDRPGDRGDAFGTHRRALPGGRRGDGPRRDDVLPRARHRRDRHRRPDHVRRHDGARDLGPDPGRAAVGRPAGRRRAGDRRRRRDRPRRRRRRHHAGREREAGPHPRDRGRVHARHVLRGRPRGLRRRAAVVHGARPDLRSHAARAARDRAARAGAEPARVARAARHRDGERRGMDPVGARVARRACCRWCRC